MYSKKSTCIILPTGLPVNPSERVALLVRSAIYYKKSMSSDRVTLKIPRPLYERLGQVIEGTGFRSVNEFVVYVLRDIMAETDETPTALTPREVELLRERLRNLGYL